MTLVVTHKGGATAVKKGKGNVKPRKVTTPKISEKAVIEAMTSLTESYDSTDFLGVGIGVL